MATCIFPEFSSVICIMEDLNPKFSSSPAIRAFGVVVGLFIFKFEFWINSDIFTKRDAMMVSMVISICALA